LLVALLGLVLLGLRGLLVTRGSSAGSSAQLLSAAKAAKAAVPTDRHGPGRAGRVGGKGSGGGSRASSGAGKAHAAIPAKAAPTPAILAKGALAAKLQAAMREQVRGWACETSVCMPPRLRISNPTRWPLGARLALDEVAAPHTCPFVWSHAPPAC